MSLKYFIQNKIIDLRISRMIKKDGKALRKRIPEFADKSNEEIYDLMQDLSYEEYRLRDKIRFLYREIDKSDMMLYISYSDFNDHWDEYSRWYGRTSKEFYDSIAWRYEDLKEEVEYILNHRDEFDKD